MAQVALPAVVRASVSSATRSEQNTDKQTMSMTSKNWVIPPRPKPGRKPATDTPPTKRKAQNRAAQRAFRERRAARVGELEDQLDEQRGTHEQQEKGMHDRMRRLELDVQNLQAQCRLLEGLLEQERQQRLHAESRLERVGKTVFKNATDTIPGGEGQQDLNMAGLDGLGSETLEKPLEGVDDLHLTCGNCSPNGACACATEAFVAAADLCSRCGSSSPCQCFMERRDSNTAQAQDLKRLATSARLQESTQKRHRNTLNNFASQPDVPHEPISPWSHASIDDRGADIATPEDAISDEPLSKDGCGFCKDGTFCVCAEAPTGSGHLLSLPDTLAPISRQTQTPPPSEADVGPPLMTMAMEITPDGAVKLPRKSHPRVLPSRDLGSTGCGVGGPGTCAQCQTDPKSGLFCRLMASKLNTPNSGCCRGGASGAGGEGGGCCKSGRTGQKSKVTLPSLPSLGLSCAETYQTLSSHRYFDKAADDIGSWLPKLKAAPREDISRSLEPGRMPMEVEAASIMSVLRDFDVRFGREA